MTKHKIGTYNVEYGHPVKPHAEMILKRFESESLDVLALLEVADYVHEVMLLAEKAGHHLLYVKGPEDTVNQAILVRKGLKTGHVYSIEMDATYFASNGALRHSEHPLAAHIDGVLYVAVHTPVGAWTPGHGGRHFFGPIRRRIAFHKYVARLGVVFTHHPDLPVVVLGDWNTTPTASGPNSAKLLASVHHARILRPHESTGHGEIDFMVATGVQGTLHVVPNPPGLPHSDHLLVVGIVSTRLVFRKD